LRGGPVAKKIQNPLETDSMAAEQPDLDDPELLKRAAAVLREIVERDWRQRTKPVLVLQALCALEEQGRSSGASGWSASDIARVMAVELGDREAALWVKEQDFAKRVRDHWKTLSERIWPGKVNAEDSALYQRFRDKGMRVYAEPQKERGGGRGNSNVYSLVLGELPNQGPGEADLAGAARRRGPPMQLSEVPEIQYLAEDVSIPKLLQWLPADGLATRSWIGGSLLAGLTATGLLLVLFALFWAWLLVATSSAIGFLKHALSTFWLVLIAWLSLRRWIQLLEDGVAKAPPFWQPWGSLGDNVLELRRDPAGLDSPRLRLARYVADCPLCGKENGRSAVRVDSGRLEFFGRRLVGRCIHAPNAHVWSFDHVTRLGRFLR
jgi:hypothetical protein